MTKRLRLVGLSLAVLAVALPAAAQGPGRVEVGASLVNFMVVFPDQGDRSILFGIPSGSFGLLSPSVYAVIFATPRLAIEPQAGAAGGVDRRQHQPRRQHRRPGRLFSERVRCLLSVRVRRRGLVVISDADTTPKQVGGGAGYRIRVGDRLVFRIDGRYTHFTDGEGNGVGFNFSIGGVFRR